MSSHQDTDRSRMESQSDGDGHAVSRPNTAAAAKQQHAVNQRSSSNVAHVVLNTAVDPSFVKFVDDQHIFYHRFDKMWIAEMIVETLQRSYQRPVVFCKTDSYGERICVEKNEARSFVFSILTRNL